MKTPPTENEDPFRLSDEVVMALAELRPMTATWWGIPGYDDAWDDLSPEGDETTRVLLDGFEGRVPLRQPGGDPWAGLAADVLADFLRLELERYEHEDPLTELNSIASPFQNIREVFDSMEATTDAGWKAKVRRVETIGEVLGGYRRTLAKGFQSGRVVAARQVRAVIEQGRVQVGDRSFFRRLPAAMEHAGVRDPMLRERLGEAVPKACAAYGDFVSWLENAYLPHARQTDAVGRDRYVRDARRFLGMDIDPEETYTWGWSEVATIGEQMRQLADQIAPGKTVTEVLDLLRSDPARCCPDVESFLALLEARQREALDQLSDTHFDVPAPARVLDVKLAPPGGPIGCYYTPPSDGFTRPGAIWFAPGSRQDVPLFDKIATAYHEGFPGHHLQVATQVALTARLSRLHRLAGNYSGYAEGWALYAEQRMAELGYYEKPEYLFGMFSCQMIRACRVVIDIGSHLELPIPANQPFHPGEPWTFETGAEMLVTIGGLQADHAASEMTRYLGWPGQAISYKVGQRVILELREAEKRKRGADFDMKDFHSRVLGYGNVGLDQLRRLVTA